MGQAAQRRFCWFSNCSFFLRYQVPWRLWIAIQFPQMEPSDRNAPRQLVHWYRCTKKIISSKAKLKTSWARLLTVPREVAAPGSESSRPMLRWRPSAVAVATPVAVDSLERSAPSTSEYRLNRKRKRKQFCVHSSLIGVSSDLLRPRLGFSLFLNWFLWSFLWLFMCFHKTVTDFQWFYWVLQVVAGS